MDQEKDKQQVSIISAKIIDSSAREDLQTQLQEILKRPVDVSFKEDPLLIAGIQIRIGSKVYDSTVKGQLQKMRGQLVKG